MGCGLHAGARSSWHQRISNLPLNTSIRGHARKKRLLTRSQEFGIDGTGRDEWIVGLINAIIFLTAGLIGAFIVDPLNHYLGRRGEIFVTALCLTATPIGSGFAKSWQGLFAARFIMGIGIGAKNATVPIYSAEMAPARIRGALVMFWQLWVVIGKSYTPKRSTNPH